MRVSTSGQSSLDPLLINTDDGWRQQRKFIHVEFSAKAVLNFRSQELKAAHDMLQRLLQSPTAWYDDMKV